MSWDLYAYQELVLFSDISPTPDYLHLLKQSMRSVFVNDDSLWGMQESYSIFRGNDQKGWDKETWVLSDGHDGAIVFEKTTSPSEHDKEFILAPRVHSHSREVAFDVAKRIVGLHFDFDDYLF